MKSDEGYPLCFSAANNGTLKLCFNKSKNGAVWGRAVMYHVLNSWIVTIGVQGIYLRFRIESPWRPLLAHIPPHSSHRLKALLGSPHIVKSEFPNLKQQGFLSPQAIRQRLA